MREYLDAAAEHWIGWTLPPVQRAIADADWKPDERDVYCHRCGDSVGPGEATAEGCGTCRKGGELSGGIGNGVVRLGAYVEPLERWVPQIKYQRWAEMGEHLGRLLAERVRESDLVWTHRTIVVPMPMPWQRRLYRGIDHTGVIATAVARELGRPVRRVLARVNGQPQVKRSPSERRRFGGDGLRIRRRLIGQWDLSECHVLLVDDVRTTGASLRSATRLLRTLKPERIVCAVLAVSDSKARRQRTQRWVLTEAAQTVEVDVLVNGPVPAASPRSWSQ
ncbi:MAG: hypothetical protein L0219_16495 [Phycisphaerales bacterium]|nr:hypothetical protein [Phycisphaerales bacterium]